MQNCSDYNKLLHTRWVSIGKRIKEVRESLGIETKALASASGLRADYISKLEGGSQQNPRWAMLQAIAKGLKVDPSVITAPVGSPIISPSRQTTTDRHVRQDVVNSPLPSHIQGQVDRDAAFPRQPDATTRAVAESLIGALAALLHPSAGREAPELDHQVPHARHQKAPRGKRRA